jgi:hypothetical protein
MKKFVSFLCLFLVALCAFASPAHAACTTAPLVNGVFDVDSGAPPTASTDWIPSFYQYPSQPYAMRVWGIGHSGRVSVGANSGVTVLTGAACVYSACSTFPGVLWTSVYLPGTASTGHIDVIINGAKVAEWVGVWNRSFSPLGNAPVSWSGGITGISANEAFGHAISQILFSGWHTDATHTFHKSVRADLENACGAITS